MRSPRGYLIAPAVIILIILRVMRLCRNVILRSEATKNLLFDFLVSEHSADLTRVRKKGRSLSTAQNDVGAIFELRHSLNTGRIDC